ncbi:uncharacterized protein LOC124488663 [Hypomesus transpacificus]|uniref:uncharacterized protein LOC124488663 n=1 Tax=Hypomesus transpacificus TaxID=137520 RepID=UPI001F072218|nr:uncharacterized protein LOC124488663 [Hypomesus transpacificus]
MDDGPYVLLYPDGSQVTTVPGTHKPFTLKEYKEEIGKTYQRLNFFICPEKDLKDHEHLSENSESDNEVVIRSRTAAEFEHADTLPFEPQLESTPNVKEIHESAAPKIIPNSDDAIPSTSGHLATKSTSYSIYTDLYAPIVITDSDEEVDLSDTGKSQEVLENPENPTEHTSVSVPDIIENLALAIDHKKVSRFNIARSNVWDGAVRGFKRGM